MTHLAGMGVRVQLSTHLSARVVYTTDTPTSLYYMDAPTSLYDGGAYTGGCILGMDISDGFSMHSRYTPYTHLSLYTAQCMHAYGVVRSISVQYIYYSHPFLYGTPCTYGESHREGCVRVPRSAPGVTSDTGCTAQLQRCVPAGPCLQWEWDHGG